MPQSRRGGEVIALDIMGAGENLASQAIVVRIRSVDVEKLRKALDVGAAGVALAPAVAIVDKMPKLAIDMALPVLREELRKMGIEAEVWGAEAPPPPRAASEALPAAAVGAAAGAGLALVGRWVYTRLRKRGQK